ncbi:MAG: histidine kinase [Verrucomicrobiota bacterium]
MSAGVRFIRLVPPLVAGLAWLAAARAAEPVVPVLTDAASVLALPAERAGQRLPVRVTGIVTAAEPDWNGQFFVQDETGGIFVENLHRAAPEPGDRVTIAGVSHPGAFAPIISAPQWTRLEHGPLPEARRVRIEDLQTGVEDSQRVEVTGVVRTARVENDRLEMALSVAGYRLQVRARAIPGVAPVSLVAARVRVRGTAATHYIGVLRHLTSVAVYVPRAEDLEVLESETVNPFDDEAIPINSIAQYRRGRRAEQRVHVRGVVTFRDGRGEIYLQDDSGGIRAVAANPAAVLAPGARVDAAGFIEYEGHLPLLRDAVFRPAGGPPAPVAPKAAPFAEIARGQHHAELVTLRGHILDRSTRPDTRPDGTQTGVVASWLVQGEGMAFTLEHTSLEEDAGLARVPVGSLIEADGLCASAVDATGKLTSLRLLLPAPASLRVLARPSWFTATRLLAGLGILSAVLLVAVAWLLTVARKNAALHRLVRELERAQRELQEAHDTLEQKVAERSAQLRVEMTARKAAELQFKAVLAERTRLARDLHDTLEQTLAGIALRLNAAAKLARRDPAASDEHLQFARNWLHQSQVDLRRSIWDLRSRELEQFDLAGALRRTAEHMAEGADLEVDFQADVPPPGLPEVVEENVLRIGQEALTNIGKHAHAKRITVRLNFDPRALRLRIEDDGVGFAQGGVPAEGHFGLTGMTERAKRLSGGLTVRSTPGRGTCVLLEIPLEPAPAPEAVN